MEQILVVDGENLVVDPYASLVQVENFLGLEPRFKPEMFVRNPETGFFCLKMDGTETLAPGVKGQGE